MGSVSWNPDADVDAAAQQERKSVLYHAFCAVLSTLEVRDLNKVRKGTAHTIFIKKSPALLVLRKLNREKVGRQMTCFLLGLASMVGCNLPLMRGTSPPLMLAPAAV